MRLVWHIARTRFGGRDAEELVSVGWVALVTAADLFDPTRGIQFTTYAYHRIWGYMRSEVKRLKAERARPRADFELEFELDLADKPRSSVFESKELAAQCLSRLRGTDREIIEAIFFEGRTRRELAKKRGCSHQFISQVYRRAMGRMKDSLR
jgi:RNA polymerase sigma factor (sigma-70 family)